MSGHRRVKGVAYNEDDFEDYEDENQEPSPEDREQLRIGRLAIRKLLGSASGVSDSEIEEALWYYFYDQDRTMSYLTRKHTPKKSQLASEQNEQTSQVALPRGEIQGAEITCNDDLYKLQLGPSYVTLPTTDGVQADRQPSVPRQGIIQPDARVDPGTLGTSPNPGIQTSKLASLSAARRKTHSTARQEKGKTNSLRSELIDSKVPVALLDRLGKVGPYDKLTSHTRTSGQTVSATSSPLGIVNKDKDKFRGNKNYPGLHDSESSINEVVLPPGDDSFDTWIRKKGTPSSFAEATLGLPVFQRGSHMLDGDLFTLGYKDVVYANSWSFSDASPDDLVGKAGRKDNKSNKITEPAQNTSSGSNDPKISRRGHLVNVAEEYNKQAPKRNVSFVVIGHVDHGKSTLMGRLLYELSVINKRSVDRTKKEADEAGKGSFAFAWLMDSTSEERLRGVTIDVATSQFETTETKFTILDAPGHQDFVPNMISGVSQADFAMLVVDASTNAFEAGLRGQTKEHALLARSMGIKNLVIAVNKMDLVDWSQKRYEEIKQQLSAFFLSAGFPDGSMNFVPCSGITGENVASRVTLDSSRSSWYDGPSLVEALENLGPATRTVGEPLRMTVSDIFRTGPQNSLSITGRIDAGSFQESSQLLIMPSNQLCHVKGIQVGDTPMKWVAAGQIPTVSLDGIDPAHLRIGDVICDPENQPLSSKHEVIAKVLAFEHLLPMELNVYKGSLSTSARITELMEVFNKADMSGAKQKPRVIKPGQAAKIRLSLGSPLAVEPGVRIVLRSNGNTVAAGRIEDS